MAKCKKSVDNRSLKTKTSGPAVRIESGVKKLLARRQPIIRVIHIDAPTIVRTDAASFRSTVQSLTGKVSYENWKDDEKGYDIAGSRETRDSCNSVGSPPELQEIDPSELHHDSSQEELDLSELDISQTERDDVSCSSQITPDAAAGLCNDRVEDSSNQIVDSPTDVECFEDILAELISGDSLWDDVCMVPDLFNEINAEIPMASLLADGELIKPPSSEYKRDQFLDKITA